MTTIWDPQDPEKKKEREKKSRPSWLKQQIQKQTVIKEVAALLFLLPPLKK